MLPSDPKRFMHQRRSSSRYMTTTGRCRSAFTTPTGHSPEPVRLLAVSSSRTKVRALRVVLALDREVPYRLNIGHVAVTVALRLAVAQYPHSAWRSRKASVCARKISPSSKRGRPALRSSCRAHPSWGCTIVGLPTRLRAGSPEISPCRSAPRAAFEERRIPQHVRRTVRATVFRSPAARMRG